MGLLSSDVESIKITFDQGNKPYLAGDEVTGTITVDFKKDVQINFITLNAWVETKTKFQITTAKGQAKRHPKFKHKKHFAKDKIIEHQMEVPVGSKTWSFSFELNKDIRSSFKGDFGSTKYLVSAHVDLPGFDKTETVEIKVNHYRNLNNEPKTLKKATDSKTTTFGMLCCESGPLSLDVSINKTGFVCGEKANICIRVDNVSGKPVKEVAVVLEQKICYHGTYTPLKMHIPLRTKKSRKRSKDRGGDIKKSKKIKKKIRKEKLEGADGNGTKSFDIEFPIDEVPPSHVDADGIGIEYKIKINAVVGLLRTVTAKFKIIIGNIPHKVAFRDWSVENMFEMRPEIREAYQNLPNYNGDEYINYETTKVREAGTEDDVDDVHVDPVFGDDVPSDSSSDDDSSDSEAEADDDGDLGDDDW